MLIEQLEELTMMAGAQTLVPAYRQERKPRMMSSLEITLEPSRAHATCGQRAGAARWCTACGRGFRMVSASAAAAIVDVSFRTLYRWAETEEVHYSATAEGALMICLDSLLDRAGALEVHTATTAELMIA